MIVFQIMYPYSENREFDMTYYLNNHLATARELLGTACLKVEIARGIKEFYPDTKPFYTVVARLVFESEESFFNAYTDEVDAFLMSDIPKFTDITPVWQLEEIVYQSRPQ